MTLYRNVERITEAIARWLAYVGGIVLAAIAVTTVTSVIGRAIPGLGPIKGDFELVEMGCAVAIFTFLPWCQLRRGHVTVDLFITRLPLRIQAMLGLIGDALIALASFVILWRLWLGFGEKFPHGSPGFRSALGMGPKPFFPETTYELEVPVWIPLGLCLIGALVFFLVSIFTVWRAMRWVRQGAEGAA